MQISLAGVKKILDIKQDIVLGEEEMARRLTVVFYPYDQNRAAPRLAAFSRKFEQAMRELGVAVVPYESVLETIPWKRKLKMLWLAIKINLVNWRKGDLEFFNFDWGKKVKKGVAIVATGEGTAGDLPVDHILNLKHNPMVLILDEPPGINESSSFAEHTEAALNIFSWNIVNLIVTVGEKNWTVYSFNMSYPSYSSDGDFKKDVRHALLPKIYAPVAPPNISDFLVKNGGFVVKDFYYRPFLNDLVASGKLFEKTKLYPAPRRISELRWRNGFYRWLGSLLLDQRTGMSYGFLARQLPVELSPVLTMVEAKKKFGKFLPEEKDYFFHQGKLFIRFEYGGDFYFMAVPDVWVLTSRSGADKTNLNPEKDIVKMGLAGGKMILETPPGLTLGPDYKPSFDTKVILAQAAANAVFASLATHFNPAAAWPRLFQENGCALAHWHGYFRPDLLPPAWYYYGADNPPVSCSAPQGAIYAFCGKERMFTGIISRNLPYQADVHIEPQHGINVSYSSLIGLAKHIMENKEITKLGNEYWSFYEEH